MLYLHRQLRYYNRKELAVFYHNIGCTYEKYYYYKLMLLAMEKAAGYSMII